jgi:hypothetical protein
MRELKQVGELRRDRGRRRDRRPSVHHDAAAALPGGAEQLERVRLCLHRTIRVERQRTERVLCVSGKYGNDTVGVLNRRVVPHEAADESHDRRVAANAERNRQQQRDGHPGRSNEASRRIPEIRPDHDGLRVPAPCQRRGWRLRLRWSDRAAVTRQNIHRTCRHEARCRILFGFGMQVFAAGIRSAALLGPRRAAACQSICPRPLTFARDREYIRLQRNYSRTRRS